MEIEQAEQDRLTLVVLRRADPAISAVCARAAFVSLYAFDPANSCWEKKDVEGPMFIVSRTEPPFFQMIVMNRVHLDNVVESLDPDGFKVKEQEPYLMYRNQARDIVGMWVHHPQERQRIFQEINSVLERSRSAAKEADKSASPHPLLQLLHDPGSSAPALPTPPPALALSPSSLSPSPSPIPPPSLSPQPPLGNASPPPDLPSHLTATKAHIREVLLLLANDDEALGVLARALDRRAR